MSLFNDQEIPVVLNYIDPDSKGFVNFRDFSDKIRVGSQTCNAQGRQSVAPNTAPSKELMDSKNEFFPGVNNIRRDIKK